MDERAVEAVVVGVELHVEPERVGDVADDRVARDGARRVHRVLAAAEGERVVRRAAGGPGEGDDVLGQDLRLLGHVEPERDRPRGGRARSPTRPTRRTRSSPPPGRSGCSTRSSARCCRDGDRRRPSAPSPSGAAAAPARGGARAARFVSGPSVTSVISPGRRRASSMIRSTAWRSLSGRLGGGSSAWPRPCGPCVSGVVSIGRTSGRSRPRATSTSVRPASSRTDAGVRARPGGRRRCRRRRSPRRARPRASRRRRGARGESSMPVSTSRISGTVVIGGR